MRGPSSQLSQGLADDSAPNRTRPARGLDPGRQPRRQSTALVVAWIAALAAIASPVLTAATIELSKGQLSKIDTVPSGQPIPDAWMPRLLISGPLVPGDEGKFLAAIKAAATFEGGQLAAYPGLKDVWTIHTVWLNSSGGDIAVAMGIARLIRTNRLGTLVDDNAVCASACVLILAGGVNRGVRDRARIGLHRPYFSDPATATGQGYEKFKSTYNEVVTAHRQFFGEMGISPRLLESMLQIPSNDVLWISSKDARSLNLDGSDPAYEEWKHAKRIATDGRQYVEWEDRRWECLGRTNFDSDACTRMMEPMPAKRPASR